MVDALIVIEVPVQNWMKIVTGEKEVDAVTVTVPRPDCREGGDAPELAAGVMATLGVAPLQLNVTNDPASRVAAAQTYVSSY